MADWCFSPAYRLYVKTAGKVWSIKTLQSAQCLLQTGQGVNQASFVIADPDGFIAKTVAPKPMALVQLWSTNRLGQGGIVWSGYVDEVHKAFDPDQGSGVTLACTGPVKLFEITRQSPGDVAGLAMAYARNVAASSVVKFAARSCGYPSSMLHIHPLADSGSGYQQIGAGPLMQPDQQPWSAVVAALQQSSGIEWFFDAHGALFWRQLNFLDPWFPSAQGRPQAGSVRQVSADDILHADMAQSDQGIVTDVQVRYFGGGGFVQSAANWPQPGRASAAHKNMVAHLRTRRLVVYAPWIVQKPHAQYLAQVLYEQYSAGVAQASVTIPADPLIEVGSLVDVPALAAGGTTRYYVTSITAQLQWGGAWVSTLGLAYGRAPDQSFPYVGTVAFPALTKAVTKDAPRPAGITPFNTTSGPYYDDTPYAIVAQSWLPKDQAALSPAVYPVGSVIYIYTKAHSAGKLVGPAALGEYTTVAPRDPTQAETTIALQSTKKSIGYVTVKHSGPAIAPEVGSGDALSASAYNTTRDGTGSPSAPDPEDPGLQPQGPASTLALRALQMAVSRAQQPFDLGHAGDDAWDCSGLVAWSYAQVGLGVDQIFYASPGNGKSWNTDGGPEGIWRFMQSIGAQETAVSAARKGDLLFCQDSNGSFSHICFCWDPVKGTNYGANWYPNRIGVTPIAGFLSDAGAPINKALDLSALAVAGQRAPTVEELVKSAADRAFGSGEGEALWQIVLAESGGSPSAVNPTSGACGLFQRLPCPWADVSTVDVGTQITNGITYVKTRYGSATKALAFRQAHGWY